MIGVARAVGWMMFVISAFTAAPARSGSIHDDESLRSSIDAVQAAFARARKPNEYRQTRKQSIMLMGRADKAGQPSLAFEAAVIAADCTFFGSADVRRSQDARWQENELRDILEAMKRFAPTVDRRDRDRYIELLAGSADAMMRGVIPTVKPEIARTLRHLATEVEAAVPASFQYSPGRKDETLHVVTTAGVLAELSWRYGSKRVARERWKVAIEAARNRGEIAAWLDLQTQRYSKERNRRPPEVPLASLREETRAGAQGIREAYQTRAGRIWVNAMFDRAYGPMLQDQLLGLEPGKPEVVFRLSEMSKARMLLDDMRAPLVEPAPSLLSKVEPLEAKVLAFEKGRANAAGGLLMEELRLVSQLTPFGPFGDPEGTREGFLTQLEELYQQSGAGFREAAALATLAAVQRALQPDEALVEYVIPHDPIFPDQCLWILLITHDGFQPVQVVLDDLLPRSAENTGSFSVGGEAPVTISPLSGLVARTRSEIRSNDEKGARQDLRALYQLLIQPLTGAGFQAERYRRVVIVPHGALHYVPFGALVDGGNKFLIEQTAITLAPSASVWLRLAEQPTAPIHAFLGFGNPSLKRTDLPSLRASETEVVNIASRLGQAGLKNKEARVDGDATVERFLKEAPNATLLHIATHGELPDENALDHHGFLLGTSSAGDGVVRASDVRKLNLTRTQVVVLSVCNGGVYRMGPGDEPYGLVPAFLRAGARNVMGTLWPVEDIYGRELATGVYESLLEAGPAEALRQASRAMIKKGQTIRRWAVFVSVGPGRPFPSR